MNFSKGSTPMCSSNEINGELENLLTGNLYYEAYNHSTLAR